MPLIIEIKKPILVIDTKVTPTTRKHLPVGRHEVERIPDPLVDSGRFWLVLVGTKIGMSEHMWRQNDIFPLET